MKTLGFICLVLFTALTRAADQRAEEFYDADVQRLIHVSYFAFGGVGIAGVTSPGEAAFRAIVRKQAAIHYILAAFESGNEPARCYALVALRESSPELFKEYLARVRQNPPKTISVMSSCIMGEEKPETIFAAIEAGAYTAPLKRDKEKS